MRIAVVVLGVVGYGLVLYFLVDDALVDEADPGGPHWLSAIGLMVADVFVPIPATVIITRLGQTYGPLLGGLIGTAGSVGAGLVAYGLTRILGRRFARWLLRDELETAERFYANRGMFAVACSRWLPLLPEAIACLAGLAGMPFGRYVLALVCGSAPMGFAYAALAVVSDDPRVPLAISVLLPIPLWWVAGRLLRASAARPPESANP